VRHRLVDHVWMEEVTLTNHLHEPSRLRVALDVDTDFADLFEVKDGVPREREATCSYNNSSLKLAYRCDEIFRSVTIKSSSPAVISCVGFAYTLELAAGEQWSSSLTVSPHAAQPGLRFSRREPRGDLGDLRNEKSAELETWLARAPTLQADDPVLVRTYRASLSELGALRMHPTSPKLRRYPRPGCPGSWPCSVATA
jgi:glycogen debranching enzyme